MSTNTAAGVISLGSAFTCKALLYTSGWVWHVEWDKQIMGGKSRSVIVVNCMRHFSSLLLPESCWSPVHTCTSPKNHPAYEAAIPIHTYMLTCKSLTNPQLAGVLRRRNHI